MSFGVTVMPDPPYTRMLELIELAEQHGFEYGWTYDSHILWQESYARCRSPPSGRSTIKLGHFVTNPGIRDPTITRAGTRRCRTFGRPDGDGHGRGDSSRRVVGLKPVKVAEFERALRMIKDLMNGREVKWNEKELKLEWARTDCPRSRCRSPATGRRRSPSRARRRRRDHPARRPADHRVDHGHRAKAAEEAGRDPDELECIVGAPTHISDDIADARNQMRWFPAMVSNHVMDLIERYGWDSEIPAALTDYVKAREFYDYKDHSRVGAAHGEFVTDEICDRFCVLGNAEQADGEAARARVDRRRPVQRLPDDARPGGDARHLRREIIPQFAGVAAEDRVFGGAVESRTTRRVASST